MFKKPLGLFKTMYTSKNIFSYIIDIIYYFIIFSKQK